MMDIDVTDAPDLSGGGGGGGPQSAPSRFSVVLVEEAIAGGTPRLGCPCDGQSERQPARVTVNENSLGSPCVVGTLSPSRITDLDVTNAPVLSSGGPPSVPSRIVVVLFEEAKAGGTPRRECPRDDQDIRSLAGVAKPASVTVYDDSLGLPCVGGTLSSSDIAGGSFRWYQLGSLSWLVRLLQVAPFARLGRCPHLILDLLAQMGRCLRLPLTMLARLAGMLLWARLGCCPLLTVTLLARLARMLQGALLAHMGRCLCLPLTMLARLVGMLLLARFSPWAGYAHRAPPPPPETSLTGIFLFSRVSWIRKKMLTEIGMNFMLTPFFHRDPPDDI